MKNISTQNSPFKKNIEINTNQTINTVFQNAHNLPENNLINVQKTPTSNKSTTETSIVEKTFQNLDKLLAPFKIYGHWKKYGFTVTKPNKKTNQNFKVTVTRNQLTVSISTNQKTIIYTINFKNKEIKRNNQLVLPDKKEATIKKILTFIIQSEKLSRSTFFEKK